MVTKKAASASRLFMYATSMARQHAMKSKRHMHERSHRRGSTMLEKLFVDAQQLVTAARDFDNLGFEATALTGST
jgi:hypothetical protein